MDGENHVAGFTTDSGVGMCCDVVKTLLASFGDGNGAVGLLCCDRAQRGEQGGIDCATVVEECANDVLDVFDVFLGKWFRCVDVHPLNSRTVLDWDVFVRLVLGRRWCGMLELEESFWDIFGHIESHHPFRLVPIDVDAAKIDPSQSMATV